MNHDQACRATEARRGSGLGVAVGRLARAQRSRQRRSDAFSAGAGVERIHRQRRGWLPFGGWAFMAADVFDDDDKVIVRIEAPGMRREDFNVELHGDLLTVWGEKQFDKEARSGRYSVVQCAYGSFRRDVALLASVKPDKTKASYRDGVLRIELPKADGSCARCIVVNTS